MKKMFATLGIVALAVAPLALGCSASSDGTGETDESLTSEDPQEALELETELAKEDSQVESEVASELADDEAADAARESDAQLEEASIDVGLSLESNGGTTAPKCKKTISVVMAVGLPTTLLRKLSNACWTVEIADSSSHRHCWYAKPIANPKGDTWVYDDTNPNNGSYASEEARVHACDNGGSRGYEYMAYRGGWRFIGATHLDAFFAELYSNSDPRNIDDLWHQKSVYKQSSEIKKHRLHTFPMIAAGETDQHISLGRQTLATCKTVRNHGYFGLYNPFYRSNDPQRFSESDLRLRSLANALNECTAPKPPKKK